LQKPHGRVIWAVEWSSGLRSTDDRQLI